MKPILALLLAILPVFSGVFGQISDDFADGNFSENPTWQGQATHFKINTAGALQLAAPVAGTSSLAVQGNIADSAIWQLYFRLEFAASTQNRLRIYLLADSANLSFSNSYFLEIGETGNTDALRFFRQKDDGSSTLLATGVAGAVGSDPVQGRLRAKKTSAGQWSLDFASDTSADFQPQFLVVDTSLRGGAGRFFGFVCQYTDSRKDKFFFDNIRIEPDLPDTQAPRALLASAQNDSTVRADFDEALDSTSATWPAHFDLDLPGFGAPQSVVFDKIGRRAVQLFFSKKLPSGVDLTLKIAGVADTLGNAMPMQSLVFQYQKIESPGEFEVLINEILQDPTPAVGLPPEAEWLEIFNASDKFIDLAELRIEDATSGPVPLPSLVFLPKTYLVLCAPADRFALAQIPGLAPVAVPNFPSLNNDGDRLRLTRNDGTLLDDIRYANSWHTELGKSGGGWSLERINPTRPCLGAENWASSRNPAGGSPGLQNSVFDDAPDDTAPEALSAFPLDSSTLRLVFSEGLDAVGSLDLGNFSIRPPRQMSGAAFAPGERSTLILTLAEPLEAGILYEISVSGNLRDCAGLPLDMPAPLRFAIPEKPDFQEIVINEILFDPATGGSRFVELLNRSDHVFDLSELKIADFSGGGADVRNVGPQRLFLPGELLALAEDSADVAWRFWVPNRSNLLENPLPSFDSDKGNATILWSKGGETRVLDSLSYAADWHNPLLSAGEREGVSLERIRPDGPAHAPENWASAAPQQGKAAGTPTGKNAQSRPDLSAPDDFISLTTNRLSPDGDGFEDFLEIAYHLPAPGFAATMTVFDADGFALKKLVRQELLGTEGTLRWDGDTDEGGVARPGIHVLFLEIFGPTGELRRVKKTVAVVKRF